eukprot:6502946-Prymnesium_polylepis.1
MREQSNKRPAIRGLVPWSGCRLDPRDEASGKMNDRGLNALVRRHIMRQHAGRTGLLDACMRTCDAVKRDEAVKGLCRVACVTDEISPWNAAVVYKFREKRVLGVLATAERTRSKRKFDATGTSGSVRALESRLTYTALERWLFKKDCFKLKTYTKKWPLLCKDQSVYMCCHTSGDLKHTPGSPGHRC